MADRGAAYRLVGVLVNDVEFIPQEIVERHLPFAVPPGTKVESVYVENTDG